MDPQQRTDMTRQQRILLWLACSAIFFEAFDVSVVNLALPLIAADLRVSLASAQWIQTVYLLSFGGFLLLGGRLCDHYGSRFIFMRGMLLFGGASALAFFSGHLAWLLPARVGQGIGAALAMPAGISLLSRHFKAAQQRMAFGIFGAFAAIGFAGGLALGGLIATLLNWHWIFGINVPVIGLALLPGHRYIPPDTRQPGSIPPHARQSGSRPNGWMAAWLTLTLLVLSGAVHEATRLRTAVLPWLAGALLSGILLLRVDRRLRQPFFGSGVYPAREAWRGLSAFTLLGASFLPFVFTCTLGLQVCLGRSVLSTGLLLFPYSVGSALVSRYLLPWLYQRMSPVRVALLCMVCLLVGDGLLAAGIGSRQGGYFWGSLLLVNSIAIAIGYPAFTVLSLTGVAPARQGIAAGIQSTLYTAGSGLGLSLTSFCLEAMGPAAGGVSKAALLSCCAVVGVLALAALVILASKPKKAYICTPI
jgi:MFS family permease